METTQQLPLDSPATQATDVAEPPVAGATESRRGQDLLETLKREQEEAMRNVKAKYDAKIKDAMRRMKTPGQRREEALVLLDELRDAVRQGDVTMSDEAADVIIRGRVIGAAAGNADHAAAGAADASPVIPSAEQPEAAATLAQD